MTRLPGGPKYRAELQFRVDVGRRSHTAQKSYTDLTDTYRPELEITLIAAPRQELVIASRPTGSVDSRRMPGENTVATLATVPITDTDR